MPQWPNFFKKLVSDKVSGALSITAFAADNLTALLSKSTRFTLRCLKCIRFSYEPSSGREFRRPDWQRCAHWRTSARPSNQRLAQLSK